MSLKSEEYSVIEWVDLRLISDSDKEVSRTVLNSDVNPERKSKKKIAVSRIEIESTIVVRLFIKYRQSKLWINPQLSFKVRASQPHVQVNCHAQTGVSV